MSLAQNQKRNSSSSRRHLLIGLASALVLGLVAGRPLVRLLTGPPSPDQVKRVIAKYLRDKSGRVDFTVPIPEGLTDGLSSTNAAGTDAANRRRQRREGRGPQLPAMATFRRTLEAASTYEQMYEVIGQELSIADQLSLRPDPRAREAGLLVAMEANDSALNKALNPWLGARIAEAYLLPLLVAPKALPAGNLDRVAQINETSFLRADETNNVIRNLELVIHQGANSNRTDAARLRLARIYEDMGEFDEALNYLTEIQNTNGTGVQRRMAVVRQRLAGQ